LVFGLFLDERFGAVKKLGQAGVKLNVSPAIKEDLVVQAGEWTGEGVREEMIEVAELAGEVIAAAAVLLDEGVGLGPEVGFIDTVAAEERRLHVFRD
jgi:hypothetical protein